MDADFWHQLWDEGRLGFHQPNGNPMLMAHLSRLGLDRGARIFVPLCGKTRDIAWLLDQGFGVVGAELSQIAIDDLFTELGVAPVITEAGPLKRYSAPSLDIYVGDVFDLSREEIGPVDATYDRAALVALPEEMRVPYGAHVRAITETAPQLLICFEYEQSAMSGPPFSIDAGEVARVYNDAYMAEQIATGPVKGGLKGHVPAGEHVWHLSSRVPV